MPSKPDPETLNDDISSLSSDSVSDSASQADSYESKITSNPMFYVLGQFLESPTSGKNLATLLEELIDELRLLRTAGSARP